MTLTQADRGEPAEPHDRLRIRSVVARQGPDVVRGIVSTTFDLKWLKGLADHLRQFVPESCLKLTMFPPGKKQAIVSTLGQHGDNRPKVGLDQTF